MTDELDRITSVPLLVAPVSVGEGLSPSPRGTELSEGGRDLGRLVHNTLREVLGWNPNPRDAKGLAAALAQSFEAQEVDGRTDWVWKPRTYAVATDLGGAISGAQASLYTRTRDAVGRIVPLLEGLKPLKPGTDEGNCQALVALIRSSLDDLVEELGRSTGPRIPRVDQIFVSLLGPKPKDSQDAAGHIGVLREVMGFGRKVNWVNTPAEEAGQTNFRILADYILGLREGWKLDRASFRKGGNTYLGTQLVRLSHYLTVIAESVEELRFACDSVFFRAGERELLLVEPQEGSLSFEELLTWISDFASRDGFRTIQEGGKYAIGSDFRDTVGALRQLLNAVLDEKEPALVQPRVRRALEELHSQIEGLHQEIEGVECDLGELTLASRTEIIKDADLSEIKERFNRMDDHVKRIDVRIDRLKPPNKPREQK